MNFKNRPQGRYNSKRKFNRDLTSPKIFSGSNIVSKKGDQKKQKAFFNKKNFKRGLESNSTHGNADGKFVQEQKSIKYVSFAKKIGAGISNFVGKSDDMPSKKKGKKENPGIEETNVPVAYSSPKQDEGAATKQPKKKTKKRKVGFSSYLALSEPKTAGGFGVNVEDEPEESMESKFIKSKSTASDETAVSGPESSIISSKKKKNKNKYRMDQNLFETSGFDNENSTFETENQNSVIKKKKNKRNKYRTEQDLSQTVGHGKSSTDLNRTNNETENIGSAPKTSDVFVKSKKNKKKFCLDQNLCETSAGDTENTVVATNENSAFETENQNSIIKRKKKNKRNKYRTEQDLSQAVGHDKPNPDVIENATFEMESKGSLLKKRKKNKYLTEKDFIAAEDNSSNENADLSGNKTGTEETVAPGSGHDRSVGTAKNKKNKKKFCLGQNSIEASDCDNENVVATTTFETESKGSFIRKKNKNKFHSMQNSSQASGHDSSKENADLNEINVGANNITTAESECKVSIMKRRKNKNKSHVEQGPLKMAEPDSVKERAAVNESGVERSIVSVKKKKNKYRVKDNSLETTAPDNDSRSEASKDSSVKNTSLLAKFGSIVRKRKAMDDSAEPQDKTDKQSKRKKVGAASSVSETTKLSKQAKKIRKELPGLDEPELTKYHATGDPDMLDDIEEESSDENFRDTSDDSSDEENEKHKSDQPKSMLEKLKTDSPEKLRKTIFVGNLPLSMTQMKLKKFFSRCGKVETTRLRSSVPEKLSIPKKVANIRHKYSDITTSLKAYVVFVEEESAKSALELNGTVIDGHHIRVDRAVEVKQDPEHSVFVGNLPYDIDDESLWKAFSEIGQVKSIRVVRDRDNGAGKGFGFVQFANRESVDEAVKVSEAIEIGGRKIRIKKSEFVPKQKQAGARRFQKIKGERSPKQAGGKQQARTNWKPIGKEVNSPGKEKPKRRFGFKKMRKEAEDRGSRKTVKKLMIKKRMEHKKKKISSLLQK